MKEKRIVLRSCVVTKEKLQKNELVRVVRNNEGIVFVDETGRQNGRGAYIKKDLEVLNIAKKNKVLERALETTIPEEIYTELEEVITRPPKKVVRILVNKDELKKINNK